MNRSIFAGLEAFGDAIAVLQLGRAPVSYAELMKDADAIGATVRPRTLVLMVCRNDYHALSAYVGLLRADAVVFLVHPSMGAEHIAALAETFRPSYMVGPAGMVGDGALVHRFGDFEVREIGHDIDYEINDSLALLLTTSGSTGSRSLVRLSQHNIAYNAQSIALYLDIRAEDRAITTMPMSYSYGFSIINSHLVCGAGLIMCEDSLVSPKFWEAVKSLGATTFGGVPYLFDILKKLKFDRMELPALRYVTQAGGNLGRELAEWFTAVAAEKGIEFFVMYGQTEAGPRIAYVPPRALPGKLGTIGRVVPGGEIWLEDEDGNKISGTNVPGELIYQGENVSLGYAESRFELANGDDNSGVLRTGDVAERDADGFYRIIGRKKRFLKLFGHRVNLDEVEQIFTENGYTAACTGSDGELLIFIEGSAEPQTVTKLLFDRTGINQSAQKVVCIDAIPRNNAGKILYPALQTLAGRN